MSCTRTPPSVGNVHMSCGSGGVPGRRFHFRSVRKLQTFFRKTKQTPACLVLIVCELSSSVRENMGRDLLRLLCGGFLAELKQKWKRTFVRSGNAPNSGFSTSAITLDPSSAHLNYVPNTLPSLGPLLSSLRWVYFVWNLEGIFYVTSSCSSSCSDNETRLIFLSSVAFLLLLLFLGRCEHLLTVYYSETGRFLYALTALAMFKWVICW